MLRLLFPIFLLCATLLSAQTTHQISVKMDGFRMRLPLEAPQGGTAITLHHLQPGEVYTVVVIGAAEGQQAVFSLAAGPGLGRSGADYKLLSTQALRFKATSEQADFEMSALSPHGETTIPFFLSVKCETCAEAVAARQEFLNRLVPPIQATSGASGQDLITNVLIGGNCFGVANVTTFGNALSRGTFTNGASSINIQDGMVMATGQTDVVEGPNTSGSANQGFGNNSPDDVDLNWLAAGNQWDVSKIEFDFTPSANFVQFEYVFGSEEYCEYVGTQFNDVFGFFISGPGITGTQNLAVLAGNTPISINTVNYVNNSNQYVNNDIFSSQCSFLPAANLPDCQLDGWTKKLVASATLIPCATYHIKLAIADVGDGVWDSAVFLKANSFNAGGTVSAAPVYANNLPSAYENCGQSYIKFSRGTGGNSQPLVITFSVSPSSTATSGVDYTALPTSVLIPAGQNEVLLPVNILPDGLTEGQEKIILLVDNLCSCTQGVVEFLINDNSVLTASLQDVVNCNSNNPVTLNPSITGGAQPYSYAWSTGETTSSIIATASGVYTVTVTDVCGQSQTATANVTIGSAIQITSNLSACPGDVVMIGGAGYTAPDTVVVNVPGAGNACDTVKTYYLQLLPTPTLSATIQFCPGSSVTIGDSTYTSPTTVTATISGQNGDCDTLATYTLELLPNPTWATTIQFCAGSSVTIGDSTYTQPTTVTAILPGQNGDCDTLATYTLQLLPQITRTETFDFCPGESVTINGTTYTESTTFTVNVDGANGACDTLVTYILTKLPQPATSTSISLCPGNTVSLGGTTYTAPNTVTLTLPGANGACDTIATYILELLPQPTTFETVYFCPGQSVQINGVNYTAPGTVVDTLQNPGGGCDIIATYQIVSLTPAPSTVKINCPPSVGVTIPAGNTGEVVTYNAPTASTDCVCPGLAVNMTSGLASGSFFPVGTTQVCFAAEDSCGNSAACCFSVTINETPPCDVKEFGCMRWELLTITQDAALNKTYRIRFKNSCENKMSYALIQLPNGVVAVQPPDNSIYTAPSGRKYQVRNPNLATFYSIRFNTLGDSISNGLSDIFKYTLPPTATPAYIHVAVRLYPRIYYEAHLNTFFCPIGITPSFKPDGSYELRVAPNPTSGTVSIDLSAWAEQRVQIRVLDGRGQMVKMLTTTAEYAPQQLALPENLSDGLYFLEILPADGSKQTARFVVQH